MNTLTEFFLFIGLYTICLAIVYSIFQVQPTPGGMLIGGVVNLVVAGILGYIDRRRT